MRSFIVALCGLALIACHRTRENPDAFEWEEELGAGATIHLRNTDGGIEVAPASDATTRVHGTTRWTQGKSDAVQFMLTRHGNDVYVCAVWGRTGRCDEHGYRSTRPGKSWLDMFSLFRRRSDAVANITVEVPADVHVDASTVMGGVHVEGARSGVTAMTTNGGISIESSSGPTVARSTNGSVKVSLDSIGDEDPLRLETINGSVVAELPANFEGEVRLASQNGRIRSEFDVVSSGHSSNRVLQGRIGDSSREIVLRSTNGSVTLRKRDASSDDDRDPDADEPKAEPSPAPAPAPPARPRAKPRIRA